MNRLIRSCRPTVFVCGHGRCGSSLVMQMLEAGGFPCFGEYPAYEPAEVGFDRSPEILLELLDQKAAKILDPQLTEWPELPFVRVIWLDRDRNQQAKSQVKFVRCMGMDAPLSAWKTLARSYGKDTSDALKAFGERGVPVLRLTFESILSAPLSAASAIRQHVNSPDLNIEAMRDVVIPRDARCQPGMDIEMRLIESRQTARSLVDSALKQKAVVDRDGPRGATQSTKGGAITDSTNDVEF